MIVEFEYKGHAIRAEKIDSKSVAIYIDGEFWLVEGNIFQDVPDDADWIRNATIGALDWFEVLT